MQFQKRLLPLPRAHDHPLGVFGDFRNFPMRSIRKTEIERIADGFWREKHVEGFNFVEALMGQQWPEGAVATCIFIARMIDFFCRMIMISLQIFPQLRIRLPPNDRQLVDQYLHFRECTAGFLRPIGIRRETAVEENGENRPRRQIPQNLVTDG